MAGFRRLNALMAPHVPVGNEYGDRAVPLPQFGHGRVYAPNELMESPVWVEDASVIEPPSRLDVAPGFTEFLRRYYLPQTGL
jgi:hypothetical protein